MSFCISKDNNFLFVGVESFGIKIFDITNRLKAEFFELIQLDGFAIY